MDGVRRAKTNWILAAIDEPAARELLDIPTRSDADPAALIGRLSLHDDAA